MSVAVLFAATLWSMPDFSHIGINMGAPPIPNVAPTAPARKPPIRILFIVEYSRDISCILSDSFIRLYDYFYSDRLLLYIVVLVLACGI